jgi:hypothetical protein
VKLYRYKSYVMNMKKNIELVHNISLSNFSQNIETINTHVFDLTFVLRFYLSKRPLGFEHQLSEVPLTFIRIPTDIAYFTNKNISEVYNKIVRSVLESKKFFLLPFSKLIMNSKYILESISNGFDQQKSSQVINPRGDNSSPPKSPDNYDGK